MLGPQLWSGLLLIMANLKAHNVAGVRNACAAAVVRLLYLPPYSPALSPIEEGWSKVKALLQAKAARTLEALEQALAEPRGDHEPGCSQVVCPWGILCYIQLNTAVRMG